LWQEAASRLIHRHPADNRRQAPPPPHPNASGLPIVNSPVTLKVFVRQSEYVKTDWNDMLQWQEMEKKTGIHIDWTLVLGSAAQEKRNLAIASGDLPDIFWGADFTNGEFQNYVDQGVFVALSDLIQNYGPNIKARFDGDPSIRRGLTLPDGKIYSLPKISENVNQRIFGKTWYYKPVLDELKLTIPETTDELLTFLRTIKTKKPDLIPLQLATGSDFFGYTVLVGGAYGIFNRGQNSPMIDFDTTTGKVRLIAASDRYREVLQYLSTLYSEKLIPQDIGMGTLQNLNIQASQAKIAVFMYNHTVPAGKEADNYINAEAALKGPYGDQIMPILSPKIQQVPAFMITMKNKYPVESMKWINYIWSPEGELLYFMGIKGVSYEERPNGELHYTDIITRNPNGLNLDEAISLYSIWPASNTAIVRQVKYALDHPDGNPKFVAVGRLLEPFTPKELWSGFWFTETENTEINSISVDLEAYIIQARTEFITGKRSFNTWNNYLNDIRRMRGDRYLQLNQAVYDRYTKG
jgi:putative aldouronate transport system substrate-binding protein